MLRPKRPDVKFCRRFSQALAHSTNNTLKSLKLFPVGPVTTASSDLAKNVPASLARKNSATFIPSSPALANVKPSATAPAAKLFPSIPSVPQLNTLTRFPAIVSAHANTNAAFLPPTPGPVTGELTSPSAINATRRPPCTAENSSSCFNKYSAASTTGQSSVELSQHVINPIASAARCAG